MLIGFKNFFEGNYSYLTGKNKEDDHFSFQIPQNYQINLNASQIYSKINKMKIVLHRDFPNRELIENNLITKEVNAEIIPDQEVNKEFKVLIKH